MCSVLRLECRSDQHATEIRFQLIHFEVSVPSKMKLSNSVGAATIVRELIETYIDHSIRCSHDVSLA